jgi:hypothetical protein
MRQSIRPVQEQLRVDKVNRLQFDLTCQQGTFKRQMEESEEFVKVSFVRAEKIAEESKTLDGEFVKECLNATGEIMCPNKKKMFKNKKTEFFWGNCSTTCRRTCQ